MFKPLAQWCVLIFVIGAAFAQTIDDFPPDAVLQRIRPEGIRAHMEFLADDLLEGRGTGTRGYELAANYVRAQFEQMRLKPGGLNGSYFQRVPFRSIELVPDESSVTITQAGKEQKLTYEKDYIMRGDPLKTDTAVEAPAVFVGFGVTAPEFAYDDYRGADVKGKIVVMLYGAPPRFPSTQRAHYSEVREKSANAVAHGATGVITIWAGPEERRLPFSFLVRSFQRPALRWLDAKGIPNDAQPQLGGSALLSASGATILFAGASRTLDQVVEAGEKSQPQEFALPSHATIHVVSRHSVVESPNVAAIRPGSDPQLKDQSCSTLRTPTTWELVGR